MSAKKWLCKICADGCYLAGTDRQISFCLSYKPQTNADRIRAMSDEELAREYALTGCPRIPDDDVCDSFGDKHTCCYNCCLDWLKQPVKDGEGDG